MKKSLILFVVSLLFSGMLCAQNYHWADFDYHDFTRPMIVISRVQFNGEFQNRADIEVAAFVGDELRGRSFLFEPYPNSPIAGQFFAYAPCYYDAPGETFTFKAYDHTAGLEYDICSTELVGQDDGHGTVENPIILNFTRTPEPTYGPEYPWVPSTHYNGEGMMVTAQIQINGQLVDRATYEVGAFCGDECRATSGDALDDWTDVNLGYFAFMNIMGNDGDVINFYLYDKDGGFIFPGVCVTTVELVNGGELGIDIFGGDIFVLNFQNDEPIAILDGGYWNVDTTWDTGVVPAEYSDVIIIGDVIIPSGYTAYAGEITIVEGGSLTIEPGGELVHSNEIPVTMEISILGYNNRENDNAGYCLIASPINPSVAVEATGLVTTQNYDEIDLYSFDQSEALEWRNYKDNGFTTFDIKQGYLYASEQNVSASFAGMTLPTNAGVSQDLVYDANAPHFAGWNLLGNPFTCKAYVDRPFYSLNSDGSAVATIEGDTIEVLEGIFVVAENMGETVTFTTTAPTTKSSLNITLNQGRSTKDNAIIRFGEGRNLGKFQLNPNHTKVYIPMDGQDYAVVSANGDGEMPVNFKAEMNGTYTLSVSAQEIDFRYLHLIDNMTGADVDLLANPTYTFDALTTDYASRFKLVFVCGDANNDNDFAFFSNGSWIINNDGKAILQVIDVNGRVLRSEQINGCASINIDEAAGVYMMRLIKGNDVKVQKIIVK